MLLMSVVLVDTAFAEILRSTTTDAGNFNIYLQLD